MSHITKIDIEVTDLTALKAACRRLGFTVVDGQKTYRWYGRPVGEAPLPEGLSIENLGRCDHAISIPGAEYEIGVRAEKGGYRLLWDSYERGGLEQRVGKGAGLLKQAYGIEKAKLEARRKGYSVYESRKTDGAITLRIQLGGGR
ncbi:MAG: DUF1257 domain-containing protein [Candidatus Manganitrophaceae bacterium]|nr:MAG: DUF1257 domain-containing protein [Candidatus Manganitrophaceae bacterium]